MSEKEPVIKNRRNRRKKEKKKKNIFYGIILFVLIFAACITGFKFVNNRPSLKKKLYSISESIEQKNFKDITIEEIEWITEDIFTEITSENNNDESARAYFLFGIKKEFEKSFEEAEACLLKTLSYLNKNGSRMLKARTYVELSSIQYKLNKTEEAEKNFEEAEKIYEETNSAEKNIIKARLWAADFKVLKNDEDVIKEEEILKECLNKAENEYPDLLTDIYRSIGNYYWNTDRPNQALNYKIEALDNAKNNNENSKETEISLEIGMNNISIQHYLCSIPYLEETLSYIEESKNDNEYSKFYAYLGLFEDYINTDDFVNAEKYLKYAEETYKEIEKRFENISQEQFLLTRAEGFMNLKNQEIDKAFELLQQLQQFKEKINENIYNGYFSYLQNKFEGDIYRNKDMHSKALECDLKALEIIETENLKLSKEQSYKNIVTDYLKTGDYANSYKFMSLSNEYKDEQKQQKNAEYGEYIEEKFNLRQNENKIVYLLEFKNKLILFLIGLLVFTSVIAFLIYKVKERNKEIKKLSQIFKNRSEMDGLTQVCNRRSLDEFLAETWKNNLKSVLPITFIMMDIDFFKKYNDNYGHLEGDEVLKKVAKTLRESCREEDFVCRYGGEEFSIIMLNTDKKDADKIIERILNNIADLDIPHKYSEVSGRITISLGYTITYSKDSFYKNIMKTADSALYEAKKNRNCAFYKEFTENKSTE